MKLHVGVIWIGVILAVAAAMGQNATFVQYNQSNITYIFHEQINSTVNGSEFGAGAYADYSITNDNIVLNLCADTLSTGQYVDLSYYTVGGNITASVLHFLPQITSVVDNCTTVDVAFANSKAIYPGYLLPAVYEDPDRVSQANITFDQVNESLNGSYLVGISVVPNPKTYLIQVEEAYDQNNLTITRDASFLATSLTTANLSLRAQALLSKGDNLEYADTFSQGDVVYVNGIKSLEIKVLNGCGAVNESGYYILNNSEFDVNETCVEIDNQNNVIINFGGEILDGDNFTNGSLVPETCPIRIRNSTSIAIENLQTQQFHTGLCVFNSTNVNIFGEGSTFNVLGANISTNSQVSMTEVVFANNNSEIIVERDSVLDLIRVNFTTSPAEFTSLTASVSNVIISDVIVLPDPPDFEEIADIGQFIVINETEDGGWAQLNFYYEEPLPNDVVVDNISIFKYNGSLENTFNSTFDNTTNITTNTSFNGWVGGEWVQIFTLISPNDSLIIAPNFTDFSLFAPYGFDATQTLPDPTPDPDPDPDPEPEGGSSGGGGGGGGSGGGSPGAPLEDRTSVVQDIVEVNLSVQDRVVLEQGQPGNIEFNLSNIGDIDGPYIRVVPQVPDSWDYLNYSIDPLLVGQTLEDSLFVAPFEKAVPRDYNVRVDVFINNGSQLIDSEFVTISVIPRGDLKRLQILEYPPVVRMPPERRIDVSFLVENRGANDLSDVRVEYQESTCISGVTGEEDIAIGQRKIITYAFFSDQEGDCQYNVLFYDGDDELVGFAPIQFQIEFESELQRQAKLILLVVLSVWTALTIIIVLRRRGKDEQS